MNADLDLTLAAVARHGWHIVLLGTRSKKPPSGKPWPITRDVDAIRRHVERGGNIGLVCGPASGVAVPDGDNLDLMRDMFAALGALAIWVETGSGKWHCYVRWEPDLPAKLMWQGRKVGELQRGGIGPDGRPVLQQVVLPPSIHPDTGRPYRWAVDPRSPLLTLPDAWRAYLHEPVSRPGSPLEPAPAWIPNDRRGVTADADVPWDGPPAEELLRRALLQPGPSPKQKGERRSNGSVKFQCPGCAAICPDCGERHDKDRDNATVFADGRFGCAVNPAHRRAIAEALGVVLTVTPTIAGYDSRILRRLGAFRL